MNIPHRWLLRLLGICLVIGQSGPPAVAAPLLEKVDIFEGGSGGVTLYRIPGIVVTSRGTVLAYCEARRHSRADWGEMEIHLRRSADGGKTWEPARQIAHLGGRLPRNPLAVVAKHGRDHEQTVNNPVAIVDAAAGAIHFLYCVEYMRCFYLRSDDDGLTFSPPVEITAAFDRFRPEYDWRVIATGPGHGIQLKNGRLLVPVWLARGSEKNPHKPSVAATIFSDDHGRSWQRGEIVFPNSPAWGDASETVAAQLDDGRVMLNARSNGPANRRLVATSRDGATGWSPPRLHDQLIEPICMAGFIVLPREPRTLLFSNPHNLKRDEKGVPVPGGAAPRQNLSVKMSRDNGDTWPVTRVLEEGSSAYSDLAVLADGTVLCFYERKNLLTVARFNVDWVTTR